MVVRITPNKPWSDLEQEMEITGVAKSGGKEYNLKIRKFPFTPGVVTVPLQGPNEGILFLNEKPCPIDQKPIDTNSPNLQEVWIPPSQNSTTTIIPFNSGWPCGKIVLPL